MAETGDPDIPIIAVHEDGSRVAVLAGDNPDSIGGAVYISEDDKALTVWVGNDGLPEHLEIREDYFEELLQTSEDMLVKDKIDPRDIWLEQDFEFYDLSFAYS